MGSIMRTGARTAWLAALAGVLLAPAPLRAQGLRDAVSGYVTLTSDYRRRGLSQSRGEPSVQLGADFQHRSGFFAGAWLASVEYSPTSEGRSSTEREVGYYAGYSRRVQDWSLTATLGRYLYPGTSFDYDYGEVSGSVGYRDVIFLTASYTDDLFSRGTSVLNTELGGVLPLPWRLELGATLGRFEASDIDEGFTHWNAGLSRTFDRIGVDVRYYDNTRYFASPMGETSGDEWVVSASYRF